MKKRIISLLLCGAMLFSLCPQSVFAKSSAQDSGQITAAGGLCEHHTEHDADCGYTEGSEGTPCTHDHSEDCYTEVAECVHEHSEDCYPEEAEDSVSGNDATPSDAEEREPENCPHICDEDGGCITKELNCQHEHKMNGGEADREGGLDRDDECGYVPAAEGTPCEYVCEICGGETEEQTETDCICTALCTTEAVNEDCPVCGAEDADLALCEGEEPAAPSNAEIVTVASVQALIDDLPNADEITDKNAEEVEEQLEAIDEAKAQLSDEEIDELDFSRYIETAAVLEQLLYGTATPSNALMLLSDYDGPAIVIGADGISGYEDAGGYHYIYYGTWDGSPVKWRVLDGQTNTGDDGLFLLSDGLFGTGEYGGVRFDNTRNPNSNAWQGSDAQEWCNSFYNTSLTQREQDAVLATTKSDREFSSSFSGTSSTYTFAASNDILDEDKFFFLSAEEAKTGAYGFTDDDARIANYGTHSGVWWLRSPGEDDDSYSGVVRYTGIVISDHASHNWAARPAFNLDRNDVLFASAADIGMGWMPRGNLMAVGSGTGEWKLTLKDDSRNFNVTLGLNDPIPTTTRIKTGEKLRINFDGLKMGYNEYVSVLLCDRRDNVLYYGRLAQNVAGATKYITIPHELTTGYYTLKVFSEQYNGDKMTSYASDFVDIPLTVIAADTTAPTLTKGEVTRDSESNATVKFTSNESGWYYYTVVDSGADAPVINTAGIGTRCPTTEQTISLTTLTAGAKDMYIVVKDLSENVSNALKIEIPAYVAPTTYTLTVEPNGGSGGTTGGQYAGDDVIQIDAGTRPGYRFSGWTSSNGGSFEDASSASTAFTMPAADTTITASWFSTDAGVMAVSVDGVAGTISETTITAQLPHNAILPTDSSKISITAPDGATKTTPITNDNGATWTFTVTAEDGNTKETYTINVSVDSTHTYGDWQSNGQSHWKECDCGEKIDEADHNAQDDGDCTTAVVCTVCGYVTKAAETSHSFTSYVSNNDATCTEDGTETAKCDHDGCNVTDTRTNSGSAKGHKFGDWITVSSPTCTDEGEQQRTCSECGFKETQDVNPNGHTWEDDYTVDKAATCTEDGSRSIHCKNCDAVKDSEVIPKTGHTYGELIAKKLATYSATGMKAHYICSQCNGYFDENKNPVNEADLIIPKLTGGGSSGGGSSSDNGGSGGTTVAERPDQTKPEIPATSQTKPATPDAEGSVSVDDGAIQSAINAAKNDAKKNGNTANGVAVGIPITPEADQTSFGVTIKAQTLDLLVQEKVKRVEIAIEGMVIEMMDDTLLKWLDQTSANGDIILRAKQVAQADLSIETQAAIGTRPAYDLSLVYLSSGKKVAVTDFDGHALTIRLPYAPAKGEQAGNLYAVYVDDTGKMEWLINSSYDADQKAIIFEAAHPGIYGVGCKNPVPAFTDIVGHWAEDNIIFAVSRGLLSGTGNNQFSPNAGMTRGMFVTALGRMANVDTVQYQGVKFSDVPADAYYAPYINWAVEKGIVAGTDTAANSFSPDLNINREQMAVILADYAKKLGYTIPKTLEAVTFADNAQISSWVRDAVQSMQQAGIFAGKDGNRFDPHAVATRAEAATVLRRFVEIVIDPQTAQGWEQNHSGSWQYLKNGKAATDWLYDDQKWYWLDTGGKMFSGGWKQIGGKWYYFYADGSMAVSTVIDDRKVGADGAEI